MHLESSRVSWWNQGCVNKAAAKRSSHFKNEKTLRIMGDLIQNTGMSNVRLSAIHHLFICDSKVLIRHEISSITHSCQSQFLHTHETNAEDIVSDPWNIYTDSIQMTNPTWHRTKVSCNLKPSVHVQLLWPCTLKEK